MSALLRVEHLTKIHSRASAFGSMTRAVRAVDDVSFAVERGEVLGIVGESGSGKTTLARVIVGLDPPSTGRVLLDGMGLGTLGREGRAMVPARMQIVFQDPHSALDPRLPIGVSVLEGARRRGWSRSQRRTKAARLLAMVGLDPDRIDDYPHQLSGGQKQRLVIARALAVEPEILILDEPVSSLDVSIQAQIINLLAELKRESGLTYMFISHDLNVVGYLSDRIGVMRRGRLVELSDCDAILSRPEHPYTRELFANAPVYTDRRQHRQDYYQRSSR